jgi:hypothetical protein
MPRVAVLGDYHGVALEMADRSMLSPACLVQVFRDHLSRESAQDSQPRGARRSPQATTATQDAG